MVESNRSWSSQKMVVGGLGVNIRSLSRSIISSAVISISGVVGRSSVDCEASSLDGVGVNILASSASSSVVAGDGIVI